MVNLDLTGKRGIVCGSTQGIGRACAVALATLGAHVTLMARNEGKLKETRSQLDSSRGQQHGYIVADFSDPVKLKERISEFVSRNPLVHILVNNTGGPKGGMIMDAETDEFLKAFSAHVVCNQVLVQALVPGMKKEGYGRIINIVSTSVRQPIPDLGVSNTIRASVAGWAKTLAGEVAQFGITVNNVLPGSTNTARIQSLIESRAKRSGTTVDHIKRQMVDEIPARRFAEPEEIASAVAFLASPAAAYINGVSLPVDGGRTTCL
jgi:3-oxoacyl-[acyl-carrier protein] reductase